MNTNQGLLVRYRNVKTLTVMSLIALLLGCLSLLISFTMSSNVSSLTTVPTKMNFQGRLTDSAGNIKPNGTYNMKLRIYDDPSAGTLKFSEERLVSAGTSVTVTNGLFSIRLNEGSNKTGTFDASIFASGSLYLEVELATPASATTSSPVWTEGAMTPRSQLATSAYAYNAETLDGIDSASFAQLTANNTFSGTAAFNGSTFSIAGTANAAKFNVASLFNVDSSTSKISIGASDTTGTVLVLDTKTDAGDPSGVVGAMYYNSNTSKFRCYQGVAWKNCDDGGDSTTVDGIDSTAFAQLSASNSFTGSTFSIAGTANAAKFNVASLFNVDSSAGSVSIGASDVTGTTFVLDTKTGAGDPSGVVGAMYYNSNAGRFRCYQGVAWKNCDDGGDSTTVDGIDSTAFAQLSANNTFTGTAAFNGTTFSLGGTANAAKFNVGSIFNIDTSGSMVSVGASDTTGTVLVLDTKTGAGDPTGANGAMYYNSNASKFRCYQAGAWTDCITPPGGGGTLQAAYDSSTSPATITTTAAKGIKVVAGAVPTMDMFTVDNAGQGVTTDNVNGMKVNYVGGTGAVEGAGIRVDHAPGGTTGSTWSGLRIVSNATGAASGVTSYGIKLEGPGTPGAGVETGLYVGTGWDIGIDIESGGIQIAAGNDPTTPAAGNLQIYAKDIAGRVMPKWIGPAGVDTPFQASMGFNRIAMMMPSGGTTGTTAIEGFGSQFTNLAATYANAVPTTTNLMTSTRRTTYNMTSTAGSLVYHRQNIQQVYRGNAANRGGFFYTIRFATSTLGTGNRAFVGLSDSIANPTNVDPTTSATIGKVGVAINANTGNWKFVTNTAASVPTATDLGATMPVNNTDLYELALFSAPNGSSIGYRLKNLSTNVSASGSASANLPANTSFLAPQFWMTNNATAGALVFEFGGWYLESDQ